jgi:hypothetical protein
MAKSFLDDLLISDVERRVLRATGARNAASLAQAIAANREAFRSRIGDDERAAAIERDLSALLSEEERQRLGAPSPSFPMGARLKPPGTGDA